MNAINDEITINKKINATEYKGVLQLHPFYVSLMRN